MSNIKPTKPSFVFGYWRPWKENSNLFDSYLDYARDTSLVKYGADTVGRYINQASKEQVQAINQLGQSIGKGMNILSNQMADINENLVFLNRNMDVQIEQQKLSNLLLQNIAELLRVPDSEKERQHSIELGIKFFVNASKDADLYADALEELLKAESLMKQDYFVLHRIGCIYLYAEKYIHPEKALEYFVRAAKYASVESDSNAARLVNVLTKNFNTVNSELNNFVKQIGLLTSDSYEKAAFSAYILGKFSDAVNYQAKALKFDSTPKNRFLLAKYQVRDGELAKGIKNLSKSIDDSPILAIATFKEIDLINESQILKLISEKNQQIDVSIKALIVKWKSVESTQASKIIKALNELLAKSYDLKVSEFKSFEKEANAINSKIGGTVSKIDSLIKVIRETIYCTLDSESIEKIIGELIISKDLPIEKMHKVYDRLKEKTDNDKLQIGSLYAGGIVFYVNETGKHGLVCASKSYSNFKSKHDPKNFSDKSFWGTNGEINVRGNGVADGSGLQNTKKIVEFASWNVEKGWFTSSKTPAPTAARLCLEFNYNGFTDWYLPTIKELQLMRKSLHKEGLDWISRFNDIDYYDTASYWSSTEKDKYNAWSLSLYSGIAIANSKSTISYIRPIRAF